MKCFYDLPAAIIVSKNPVGVQKNPSGRTIQSWRGHGHHLVPGLVKKIGQQHKPPPLGIIHSGSFLINLFVTDPSAAVCVAIPATG